MPKYRLKFKNKGENCFLYLPIEATEKKEAIEEARDFISRRGDIQRAYLEEMIHKTQKVWGYETEV